MYGPRPARRFRLRAVIFALVGGIVLGIGIVVAGMVTLFVLFPDSLAPGTVAGTHAVIPEGAGPLVGDCLLPSAGDADMTSLVDVVDCRELHGSEVIGLSQLPEVTGGLDRTDVDYFADGACRIAFRDYVGGNYDELVAVLRRPGAQRPGLRRGRPDRVLPDRLDGPRRRAGLGPGHGLRSPEADLRD